jgi:GT2 family glycosyltransferase
LRGAKIMTIALPRSGEPRVSIVIASSTRTDLLQNALRAIARNAPEHIPFETIVILNGAGADAETQLRAMVSGVEFVASPVNLGFAGAGNLARSYVRGEFILLMQDDTEALPGWMDALVAAADANPHAGAIGSKVIGFDGEVQYAGAVLWRNGLTSLYGTAGAATLHGIAPVDYSGTASLLVRATDWDAVGGLNEELYPVLYVDVDLCTALWHSGAAVLCEPASQIQHHRHASTRTPYRLFLAERNRALLQRKWATALEAREPYDGGSAASLTRAADQARARAADVRARGRTAAGEPRLRPFDPIRQRQEHEARARAVQQEFIAHAEGLITGLTNEVADARQQKDAIARELGTVLQSRSWRLTAPLRWLQALTRRRS